MSDVRIIDDLDDIPSNARLCIYGAGGYCQHLLKRLPAARPDIKVPFLVDTFKTGQLGGLDIVKPRSLMEDRMDDYDMVLILGATVTRKAILSTLESLGVNKVIDCNDKLQDQFFFLNMLEGRYGFNTINLELTSKCNMVCEFCGFRKRPMKNMEYNLFKEIIDQIVEDNLTQSVILAGGGEPLLYPKLASAVRYCKSKHLHTSITTNGVLLTEEKYQELLDSGVDFVTLSLHNLSEDSFAYRNAKIDFKSYFKNMVDCVDYHVRRKAESGLQIILMYDSMNGAYAASEIWGLPAIKKDTENAAELFQPFLEVMQEIANNNKEKCHLSRESFLAGLRNRDQIDIMPNVKLRLAGLDTNLYVRKKKSNRSKDTHNGIRLIKAREGGCVNYILNPQIVFDGSFLPCCRDAFFSELVMGKVGRNTKMTSLLNSSRYKKLFTGFMENKVLMPTCQECLGKFASE